MVNNVWVFLSEEILRSHLAHWWSPDGERLAFLTIDDTLVPNMALAQFTGSTYPRGLQYPYPMVSLDSFNPYISVINSGWIVLMLSSIAPSFPNVLENS